jgi:hypothetical protein
VHQGRTDPHDGDRDHRRLSKAVPARRSDKTQGPEREIGETHLLLERITLRPTDRLGDGIGREDVTEETAEPARTHPEHEEIDQVHLYFPETILRARVESNMEGGEQHREDGEREHPYSDRRPPVVPHQMSSGQKNRSAFANPSPEAPPVTSVALPSRLPSGEAYASRRVG